MGLDGAGGAATELLTAERRTAQTFSFAELSIPPARPLRITSMFQIEIDTLGLAVLLRRLTHVISAEEPSANNRAG